MAGSEDADRCRRSFPQRWWFMMSFISPYFRGYLSHRFMTGTNTRHEYIMSSHGFYFSIFTLNLHFFQHCNQASVRKILVCANAHNYRFILCKIYNHEKTITSFSPLLQTCNYSGELKLQKNTKTQWKYHKSLRILRYIQIYVFWRHDSFVRETI